MINDYPTLQAAIADELARADLAGVIPQFIQLAEADLNRVLRTRQMQAMVTGQAIGQNIPIPADLRELEALYISYGGRGLEVPPMPASALAEQLVTGGAPVGYVAVGSNLILIGGSGDLDYTLTYYQALPDLENNNQNWLILREPGLYLYSALTHSAPYMRDDPRIQTWAGIAQAIRDGMKAEDAGSRYGNSPSMQPGYRCAP